MWGGGGVGGGVSGLMNNTEKGMVFKVFKISF